MILSKQNVRDREFVLLFRYNKNIKINRPTTDKDVAVYGIIFKSDSFITIVCFHTFKPFPLHYVGENYENPRNIHPTPM